ncbi:alpha/beta hydrolase family protein [Urbifossiella limnaea]|uniref:Isoform II n=1 Tax=Urbifossiella limnaea TaxID=2528023 RepID=A0A517Y366_9BACT|nr:hypothetical protein [Urbifossiella limnaea]QDU24158.1 isoform II [Urbifossiella limnaea]
MRPLEIAFWAATAPVLLWCLSHRDLPAWVRVLSAVATALLVAHVATEGWRWHLVPAYLTVGYVFLTCVWPGPPRLEVGPAGAAVGLGLLAAAAGLAAAFPVFDLPKPTGRYPVGTVTLHRVDPARADPRTDRPDGRRELMIQVWYPAERPGPGHPYRQSAETTFLSRHLSLVRTHAAYGVPVATDPGRHPVVVFAPSWGGCRGDNTTQAEELASHGFVVVGIDHPYFTDRVVFPDGREARTVFPEFLDYATEETLAATRRTIEDTLTVRVADARFVLDEVGRLDRADPGGIFTGRLDTSRIGMFGHSFGGAVSAEACLLDSRVAAGFNLDGFIFGRSLVEGPGKPFVFITEDVPEPTQADVANARNDAVRRRHTVYVENFSGIRSGLARVRGHYGVLRGGLHVNFGDAAYFSPIRRLRPVHDLPAGSIRPDRAMRILNTYLLSFFRKHLTGEDDGLFDSPSPFPELEIARLADGGR